LKRRTFLIALIILCAVQLKAQTKPTPVNYLNPDWSPDGSKLLFESNREGKFAIYKVNADGSGLRRLTDATANDTQPRWSPNGREIVFVSDRDGRDQLYLMKADGSQQRRLTNGDESDFYPAWNPKGDWIVFGSQRKEQREIYYINVIRTDGSGRTCLTDGESSSFGPKWSPDGARIVFTRAFPPKRGAQQLTREEARAWMAKTKSSQEIFVMNRDGSGIQNLTNNEGNDDAPHWSSDGKRIYFVSERADGKHIYVMDADGASVRSVADISAGADSESDQVAAVLWRQGADVAITSARQISPNRKYIVYTKSAGERPGLYLYELKTGKERLLIGG
jgi:Tol biopolymer transport system component